MHLKKEPGLFRSPAEYSLYIINRVLSVMFYKHAVPVHMKEKTHISLPAAFLQDRFKIWILARICLQSRRITMPYGLTPGNMFFNILLLCICTILHISMQTGKFHHA